MQSATILCDDFRALGVRERCGWHFDHLGEALDAASLDGLSVLASRPSRSAEPLPVAAALNRGTTLAPASRLAFVYRSYRACIAMDATRWLAAPHGSGTTEWRAGWELLASKICALLRSAARGFGVDVDNQVPADAVRFCPDVLISIIVVARPLRDPQRARLASAAPRDDSRDVRVIAQGMVLNSATLPEVERTVRAGLRRFEASAAAGGGRECGSGGVAEPPGALSDRPSTARASASSAGAATPISTRRARGALASCIRHGRVALELMPSAAAPVLVIFTDGSNTLDVASRQEYDSLVMRLNRADIALSFVHVGARGAAGGEGSVAGGVGGGAGSSAGGGGVLAPGRRGGAGCDLGLGHVPDESMLATLARAAGGRLLRVPLDAPAGSAGDRVARALYWRSSHIGPLPSADPGGRRSSFPGHAGWSNAAPRHSPRHDSADSGTSRRHGGAGAGGASPRSSPGRPTAPSAQQRRSPRGGASPRGTSPRLSPLLASPQMSPRLSPLMSPMSGPRSATSPRLAAQRVSAAGGEFYVPLHFTRFMLTI